MQNECPQKNIVQCTASGKIILSGEYSVIYGAPALGIRLNRLATTTTFLERSYPHFILQLLDLSLSFEISPNHLYKIKKEIDQRYQDFLNKSLPASEIIKPQELLLYALALYAEYYDFVYSGFEITVTSNIPMGCGLGSSASSIISLLKILSQVFVPISSTDQFMKIACQIENLAHGKSSGFDVALVLGNDCLYRHQQENIPCVFPKFPFQLVNTGIPEVTTSKCVQDTSVIFKQDNQLLNRFSQITLRLIESIKSQNQTEFQSNIAKNHRLLCDIGVVPDKVKACVADIEKRGNVAKICGAGANSGDGAGVLFVAGHHPISDILNSYGYKIIEAYDSSNYL